MGRRELFELWVSRQYGVTTLLEGFSDTDGYPDMTINAMWAGFNAGIELSQ